MSQPDYTNLDTAPDFAQLRRFDGPPTQFWPLFVSCARRALGARRATLTIKAAPAGSDSANATAPAWRAIVSDPSGGARLPERFLLERALAEGLASGADAVAFAVGGPEMGAGVIALELRDADTPANLALIIELLGAIPDAWQAERSARALRARFDGVVGALDLGLVVGAQRKFTAAAFAVCNELLNRLRCDRVSLGWQDDLALCLQAISQADKFDKRTKIVRQVEAAMEESFDQDEPIRIPLSTESDQIAREHEAYAKEAAVSYLCSMPLRADKEPRGVWLLERSDRAFSDDEVGLLRIMADQVGQRLADLRECDRWWPARLWRSLKARSSRLLGPRHTGPKLAGIGGALVVLFLVFGRLPYSVEAPATLRSGQVAFVTAPFDGFIDTVTFEVGDTVSADATLVTFDTGEILAQQAAELANLNRYTKEVERARAKNELADMRVAQAQVEQAQAVLDRTRFRLAQADIKAPMEGVIVEGDLRKRIGAPVRQGEVLLQQARLDDLYVRIEVSERDVHEIMDCKEARMLFASRPDQTYPLVIERVQPAGLPTDSGIVFQVRARSVDEAPGWWRPGMSGTVRIDAGWRNAGWIMTHRTTDWLRRQLWW